MNQKQQDKELTRLKENTLELISFIEENIISGAKILNEGELDNDALELIQSYLFGDGSLKTLRAELKKLKITRDSQLFWHEVDGGWEAVSVATYEPGNHMSWRIIKKGKFYIDDSTGELRIDAVKKAKFKTLDEAKVQYQVWENQMISEMGK